MGTLSKALPNSLSLVERLKLKSFQPALLLDTSGSMRTTLDNEQRKIDVLRSIVSNLQNIGKVYSFNSSCQEITRNTIPEPAGGTYFGMAFDYMKSKGHKKVVIVTDGEASDKSSALEKVAGLDLQILYIGPEPIPEFLKLLASKAGGLVTQESLMFPKELETKLMLLLESGSSNIQL